MSDNEDRLDKPFTSSDEQIKILKSRGMEINDFEIEQIKIYLLRSTYYNVINSCGFMFKKSFKNKDLKQCEEFVENTTFNQVYSVYMFEKSIKNRLMRELLKIEDLIKSVMIYIFNENHKEKESFLIQKNYNPKKLYDVNKLITALNKKIEYAKKLRGNKKDNNAISSYLKKHDNIPIWVMSKDFDFGTTKKFYKVMNPNEKELIAEKIIEIYNSFYKLEKQNSLKLSLSQLENYIDVFKELRNAVAHNNNLFFFKGYDIKSHRQLFKNHNIKVANNYYDIYYIIIIMEMFLNQEDYRNMIKGIKNDVRSIKKKLTAIDSNIINELFGFPANWEVAKPPKKKKVGGNL